MHEKRGFTLVELLVASALFSTILLALGGLYAGSYRALGANELASEQLTTTVAATEIFRYDLALAGYRGTDEGAADRGFAGATLTLAQGASDRVGVQYYEDRFVTEGNAELRRVTFAIGSDTEGRTSLLRREGNAAAQPVVPGASSLKLVEAFTRSGSSLDPERIGRFPKDLSGLRFDLGFEDGRSASVFIPLVNVQRTELIGHGASYPLND